MIFVTNSRTFHSRFPAKRMVLLCCLIVATGIGTLAAQPTGYLYFLGLTEKGWQVAEYDFETGEHSLLTDNYGDKRQIVIHKEKLYFRDSNGRLFSYAPTESVRAFEDCQQASIYFDIAPKTDDLWFCAISSHGNRKQWIYRFLPEELKTEVIYRPSLGSAMSVEVSPDNSLVATTLVARTREERLAVFPPEQPEMLRFLTPEYEMVTTPSFSSDGSEILYSQQQQFDNSDLYAVNHQTGVIRVILESRESSEFHPVDDSSGRYVFYERRHPDLPFALAWLDSETGERTVIDLDLDAKEPIWSPFKIQ